MPDPISNFPTSVDTFAAAGNSGDLIYGIATAVRNIQKVLLGTLTAGALKIVGNQTSGSGVPNVQITGSGLGVGSGAQPYEAGDIAVSREASPTAGVVYFGNTLGTKYLYYDGTNYLLAGGNLTVSGGALQIPYGFMQNGSSFALTGATGWRNVTTASTYTPSASGLYLVSMYGQFGNASGSTDVPTMSLWDTVAATPAWQAPQISVPAGLTGVTSASATVNLVGGRLYQMWAYSATTTTTLSAAAITLVRIG